MFPTLTRARCDCCDDTLVDEVGVTLVWDAVRAFRDERDAGARRDEQAWADAANAIAEARAG